MKRSVTTRDGLRSGNNNDKGIPARGGRDNGGRGSGRGTGRGSTYAKAVTQETSKTQNKISDNKSVENDSDADMVDDLNLLEQDRTLEVIQEDANNGRQNDPFR